MGIFEIHDITEWTMSKKTVKFYAHDHVYVKHMCCAHKISYQMESSSLQMFGTTPIYMQLILFQFLYILTNQNFIINFVY